jgi:hypothetical protein
VAPAQDPFFPFLIYCEGHPLQAAGAWLIDRLLAFNVTLALDWTCERVATPGGTHPFKFHQALVLVDISTLHPMVRWTSDSTQHHKLSGKSSQSPPDFPNPECHDILPQAVRSMLKAPPVLLRAVLT